MTDEPGLEDAYSLDGPEAVRALYSNWADSFESGFLTETGYVYHEALVEIFAKRASDRLSLDDAVLDVGCGTGIGGVQLKRHGPWAVDGLDLSPEMLNKAADKTGPNGPVYRELIEANLMEPLSIADSFYDGLISIGTFTHGHVGPEALGELIRIVRLEGLICLGINEEFYEAAGFGAEFDRLEGTGVISKPEMVQVRIYDTKPDAHPHANDTAFVTCFTPTDHA